MLNSINTNVAAFSAQANIGKASTGAGASIARLSSGNRIVKSSDDVAALSIGTILKTGVTTLRQALSNTNQGSSLLQVADGALAQISDILQRQKAIATQANSGTLTDTERGYLDQEFQALKDQIDQISSTTTFSSVKLLNGSLSTAGADGSALKPDMIATGNQNAVTIDGFNSQGVNILNATFTSTTVAGDSVNGDESFYGDLSAGTFTVTDITTDADTEKGWQVRYVLNGTTYLGVLGDAAATTSSLALVSGDGRGTITLTLAADMTADTTTPGLQIATAANFQTLLTNSFASATAYVQRTGVAGAGGTAAQIIAQTDAGQLQNPATDSYIAGFDGADIIFRTTGSASFDIPDFDNFRADGYRVGSKISVTINGETYTTKALLDNTDIRTNDGFGDGAGIMILYREGSGPKDLDYLRLNLGGVTANTNTLPVNTSAGMSSFLSALNEVFNPVGSASGSGSGLTLQVGLLSSDTLSLNISSASTANIYQDANGSAQTLDVTDTTNAQTASDILDLAIATINSQRAGIGALQSRIDFTAANLQSSIENQDAARGTLLDTDVAAESTAYATKQVQLQAGIAVLAQANQLPQNLLKLIS